MSQSNQDQIVDILANGMENFVNATGDREMSKFGAMVLSDIKDVFIENIKAGDTCAFAFPSMVVLPDIRVECFVAILNDRVVVAWRKGIFRKTTVSRIIPKRTIKQSSWAISNHPSQAGAALLTIIADETISIAMPKGKPTVADAILAAVQAQ